MAPEYWALKKGPTLVEGGKAMARRKHSLDLSEVKRILREDRAVLQDVVREALKRIVEAEMTETLGGSKGNGRRVA